LRSGVRGDLEEGRGLAWASLAVVAGVAGYFALPAEPSALTVCLLAFLFLALALRSRRRGGAGLAALVCGLLLCGVGAGALRTALVAAPVLERARSLPLAGFVEAVEQRTGAVRLTLLLREAGRMSPAEMPHRVRITLRGRLGEPPPAVATAVSLRARLMPPPDAVMPGGYDFAFRAFFARLGGTGFAFTAPREIDLGPPPLRLRLTAGLAGVRGAIASRIQAALGRDTVAGSLAVALIVGDRSAIPPEVTEVLRSTGLAHILAISGLHMALFSGAVFFVVRAVLALMREISDTRPIDLWAAGAALAAAAFYLAISGASVATQRAFVMTVLVLAGRMAGRRALTLRNAAIAALLILLPAPESLLDPGFQMSFAAVVALIAAYENLRRIMRSRERVQAHRADVSLAWGLPGSALRWIGALLLTSLVAGLATGAIGAFHFHRIAPLGPLVNLIAMPLVTLVVMPMAVLALALLPLGLELLPLTLMGLALDKVVAVAAWANQWTPAEGVVGAPSPVATLLLVIAGGVLCLAPRGGRRLALLPLLAAVGIQSLHRQPDLLIASDGDVIALRDAAGRLRVSARPGSFVADMWLRAEGIPTTAHPAHALARGAPHALARGGASSPESLAAMSCDASGCVALAHGSHGAGPSGSKRDTIGPDAISIGIGSGTGTGFATDVAKNGNGSGDGVGGELDGAGGGGKETVSGAGLAPRTARNGPQAGTGGPQTRAGPIVQGGRDGPGKLRPAHALVLALARKPEALAEDCARADILVTPLQAPQDCAAPYVFDGPRLAREGAVSLYLDPLPPDANPSGRDHTHTRAIPAGQHVNVDQRTNDGRRSSVGQRADDGQRSNDGQHASDAQRAHDGQRTRDRLPFSVRIRVAYARARPWTPRARLVPAVSPALSPAFAPELDQDWALHPGGDEPDIARLDTAPLEAR
jgi:competence protein ComEC